MKAAVFLGGDRPLEVTETPTPSPGDGEALIRVAGCGMCHTDLHYIDHGVAPFASPPLILGHEAAGTIEDVGADVSGFRTGDPVLIPAVLSCGYCRYCRRGRENLCSNLRMLGNHVQGAYAEFVAVPARELVRLPDSLAPQKACVIADALSTPYHAVKNRARVRPGEIVAVVGCGGVGLNVIQCAAAAGGQVIALDINEARLELARELGASEAINPERNERIDKRVRKATEGGVDVAFEAVGDTTTQRMAYSLLRPGGRLCVIGYSHDELSVSAAKLMFYELEVIGSLGCGAGDYPEIIRLVEDGRLTLDPIVSGTLPLEQINEGLDRLRAGIGVRWVITPR